MKVRHILGISGGKDSRDMKDVQGIRFTKDGWQSSWAKLSIPFPDGARIKLNPLLHN